MPAVEEACDREGGVYYESFMVLFGKGCEEMRCGYSEVLAGETSMSKVFGASWFDEMWPRNQFDV